MGIDVREQSPERLAAYGRIPIAFDVREVFDVVPAEGGLGGWGWCCGPSRSRT
jgi:hypothetical protein